MRRQPRGTLSRFVEAEDVYYTVYWSRFAKANKYHINARVPAFAGIYELYHMDERKKLVLMQISRTWYGGLRYALRTTTDPELVRDERKRKILDERDCYYRYCAVSNLGDMMDLLFFFEQVHYPGSEKQKHSNRYRRIHVRELSDDKLVTI